MRKHFLTMMMALAALLTTATASQAAPTCKSITTVKLGVSIYAGWQPHYWAKQVGLYKQIGAEYCLDVQVVEFPNYGPSIDAYTAGQVDALVITNMDALTSPVSSGIDTTVVIYGDFSDGNDGILSKDKTSIRQLKGQDVFRAQNTVTDYLIARALAQNGMSFRDINLQNLDDGVHVSTFESNAQVRNLGTWNPYTLQLQNFKSSSVPTVNTLFTSHQIPGEIQDLLVVTTKMIKAHPEVGDAFAKVWYQHAMPAIQKGDQTALGIMASTGGSSLADYTAQLKTTHLYFSAREAADFTKSQQNKDITKSVRDFVYSRQMMGPGKTYDNRDDIGISFPDGTVLGNKKSVLFHYDNTWMEKAANGQYK